MPGSKILIVTKGKKTKARMCLLKDGDREPPDDVVLTLTAAAAKGATTLTLTSVTTKIYKGQHLLFEDPDEKVYKAIADADYTTGTTLTVKPLSEAIPDDSVAAFPVPFKLRESADISASTDVSSVNTFDHEISSDFTPGESTYELSTDGKYSHYDPGYGTCGEAQRTNTEIYFWRELAPPSPAFSKGKISRGACLVTSRDEPSPNDGEVGASVSMQFVSGFEEDEPVPVA